MSGAEASLVKWVGCISPRYRAWKAPACEGREADDLLRFTNQMAVLLGARVSVLRSLEILEVQQSFGSFPRLIRGLLVHLMAGESLSQAMARFPRVFDPIYLNTVGAGEAVGRVDLALLRLGQSRERVLKLRKKLKQALIRPLGILFYAAITLLIYGLSTLHVFQKFMVEEAVVASSWLPAFLVCLEFIRLHWPLLLSATATILALLFLSLWTRRGRWVADWFTIHTPLVGPLTRTYRLGAGCSQLAMLLDSGLPLLEALRWVQRTEKNALVAEKWKKVLKGVRVGQPFTACVASNLQIDPWLLGMLQAGEDNGRLAETLRQVVNAYQQELDHWIELYETSGGVILTLLSGVGVGMCFWAILSTICFSHV